MENKKIEIPDFLVEFTEKLCSEKEENKRRAEVEYRKRIRYQIRQDEEQLERRRRLGLKWAKKIFKWAESFRKSDNGKKLFQLKGSIICFFDEKVMGSPWRMLGIDEENLYWHSFGCCSHYHELETPINLAELADPEVLEEVWHLIESGGVWETMKRTIERWAKSDY